MDGIASIRNYINRLIDGDGRCLGMKVLLLDSITSQVISCVSSQTEILSREVYLVTKLDRHVLSSSSKQQQYSNKLDYGDVENGSSSSYVHNSGNGRNSSTAHLKAVCFVRPTEINLNLLVEELRHPKFAEYHLFFSGIVNTSGALFRKLAEADVHERVVQVQEFYGDFVPINEDLLTLNCRDHSLAMTTTAGTALARDHIHLYERHREGLCNILLAMKKKPSSIRYQESSAFAKQLAHDVNEAIAADQIFHFRGKGPLLLVLDRMDDPVTPLLSQWTYQAMVHELLGLNNNRVMLKGAPGVQKDLEEVVLSPEHDEFFFENRHANFGELGEAIKNLLDNFQKQQTQHRRANLNSIEDMQAFMEKFPEFRTQSHNVSKHVSIMGELARLVDVCSLMDVSQFEQELACADDHASHIRELLEKLQNPRVKTPDKLRLGLLYALRYEHSGNINKVKKEMMNGGVSSDMVSLVDKVLQYAGSQTRGPGLYGSMDDIMSKMTKSIITSVQGVSNVYSQHVPVLIDTINNIIRGKLKESSHPYIMRPSGGVEYRPPQEIIVFMAGGVTYEEATKISEFNSSKQNGGVKVILAGSTVHNSTSFLEELKFL